MSQKNLVTSTSAISSIAKSKDEMSDTRIENKISLMCNVKHEIYLLGKDPRTFLQKRNYKNSQFSYSPNTITLHTNCSTAKQQLRRMEVLGAAQFYSKAG